MYKNPQASDQAKRLRGALTEFGASVTHAQALEVLARIDGVRTLHVAQAKNNSGVRIADVSRQQAEVLMFDSLGKFQGRLPTLLAELRTLVHLDARETDELYRSIFREEHPVVVSDSYGHISAEELPDAFERLVKKLQTVLVAQAQAPERQNDSPLYEGPVLDWRVVEDDGDVPQHCRDAAYRIKVERVGHQFYVSLTAANSRPEDLEGQPQLGLIIEVNEGLPCVHVNNDVYGDNVVAIFSTADGLYLRPGDQDSFVCTGVPGPELPQLHAHWLHETQPPFQHLPARNHAFLVNRLEAD